MSSVRRPHGRLFQIRGPAAPNSSVSKAVVRTWHRTHIRGRKKTEICSAMTVVSDNIRFMRIFEGVLWRRGVKQQWDNRKRRFSGLSDSTFSEP